ncbi:(2Fe-2S)-binding protein [Methylomagnum sp.]
MNTSHPDRKKDIVCRCSGTTTEQIKRHVANGVNDLDGLSRATGVCSGCGGCDTEVLALLAESSPPLPREAS